jgi:hypothetical protein
VNRTVSLIILSLLFFKSYSQDTLPNFTIVERANKVTISWYNPYQSVVQLNVQRSFDSAKNFSTVFSPTSPQLPQNGYTETKMPTNQIYYRIFYVLEGGAYFFTKSRRSGSDARTEQARSAPLLKGNAAGLITVRVRDSFYANIPSARFRFFRDSLLQNTKDTLTPINDSLLVITRYSGPENFRPSLFIFSNRFGISINLPNATSRRYKVKFFEENGTSLFEIAHIKETQLIIDKSNFLHAGWFFFELYEDDRLKEKNRFYLSKDF